MVQPRLTRGYPTLSAPSTLQHPHVTEDGATRVVPGTHKLYPAGMAVVHESDGTAVWVLAQNRRANGDSHRAPPPPSCPSLPRRCRLHTGTQSSPPLAPALSSAGPPPRPWTPLPPPRGQLGRQGCRTPPPAPLPWDPGPQGLHLSFSSMETASQLNKVMFTQLPALAKSPPALL